MKKAGTIVLRRTVKRVTMTILTRDVIKGLGTAPGFGVRSVHFGTKRRGYDIRKGEGYGWDGKDRVTAKRVRDGWRMRVPVRDNDPKDTKRRFVKGNCYVRTRHNEIFYFDPRRWKSDPPSAIRPDGHGGWILDIDLSKIPTTR